MKVMYPRCAGLDVHKKTVVACRMRTGKRGKAVSEPQTLGTTTGDLFGLVDWLTHYERMAATGGSKKRLRCR